MPIFLLKLLTHTFAQRLAVSVLEDLAKRSDNTIDDRIVRIVKYGIDNRVNPINRAADIAK